MKLIKLDHTGHTELEMSAEEMVKVLETDMNKGYSAITSTPGVEPSYVRDAKDVLTMDPATEITLMPRLVGGSRAA